jgi:chromosomal replication initiation ATPase DnaA
MSKNKQCIYTKLISIYCDITNPTISDCKLCIINDSTAKEEICETNITQTPNKFQQDLDFIQTIIDTICTEYEVDFEDLKTKSKEERFVIPRQIIMYLINCLREQNKTIKRRYTQGDICKMFNRSVVMLRISNKVIINLIETNKVFAKQIETYKDILEL